ncbi:MAG: hypothetical protein HC933_03960 [Pleurocapsa sp. SU_196_0]|nr:hypothetical protein [Pleurocapsa sp. SU_196_0]
MNWWSVDPARVPEAIALAEHVLRVAEQQFNVYYSETGQLARAAQTLAHNSLSWYLLQSGQRLEEALALAAATTTRPAWCCSM